MPSRVSVPVLVVLLLTGCAAKQQEATYLQSAMRAARWIQAGEQVVESGKTWPPDPQKPDEHATDLYTGSSGVVLFFLEAYRSTGDLQFLADARDGADHLLSFIPAELGPEDAGLYTGIAGTGFALLETYKVTEDATYRRGAVRCVEVLRAHARKVGDGVEWNDTTDIISGGAGTGLFLLYAARELELPAARTLAVAAGRRLIELAQGMGVGKNWAMSPTYPRLMPNFSHGTAGVAYFLGTLYEETKDRRFLDAAVAGARYLQSVAVTVDGGCLIHHHQPGGDKLFYLGWCHGPVGTARLFYRLAKATGDPEWMPWVRRSARSVMTSGIPEQQTSGFWNNAGYCCGLAGVAEFFLDLYCATGDREYFEFAERVAAETLNRATETERGLKWIQAEHRVRPELLIAQTGYMQGAAGVGIMLLHLDAVHRGRSPTVILPDSPFRRDARSDVCRAP